jgi:Uma2 family endonuclease
MSVPGEKLALTPEDYIKGEITSEQRHEYIDGEVFAMSGGSDAHETINLNIAAILKQHLKGSQCRTYASGMKVRVDETKFLYPDVFVTCEATNEENYYAKGSPELIIEVLSPSTEAYDRGQKFHYYRRLASLQEYLLVSQTEPLVDLFRREGDHWLFSSFTPANPHIVLESVGWQGDIHQFYEDVVFLPEPVTDAEPIGNPSRIVPREPDQ